MKQRVEIRDGREFVVTTLPQDKRLTPSATRERQLFSALRARRRSSSSVNGSPSEEAQAQAENEGERGEAHVGLTGGSGPPPYKRRQRASSGDRTRKCDLTPASGLRAGVTWARGDPTGPPFRATPHGPIP